MRASSGAMHVREHLAPSALFAQGLAMSEGGELFWISMRDRKATLEVWNARTGGELGHHASAGQTASTRMVASDDGSIVAVAGTVGAKRPRLWCRTKSGYKASSPDLGLEREVTAMTLGIAPVLVASDVAARSG